MRIFSPFIEAPRGTSRKLDPDEDTIAVRSQFRPKVIALNSLSIWDSYEVGRSKFESPPYDFKRIDEAIDTDSYAKQAFAKYRELFWKEGWEIVSENPDAVDYLYQRIDYMETAMGRPFQEFLVEIFDNLVRYHNVFIVKERGDLAPYFPGRIKGLGEEEPILGYYLIPTETIEISRTKYNDPLAYRQKQDEGHVFAGFGKQKSMPKWPAKSVIHLFRDRKTGRQFGTPFLTAALEDLIALRQIEEDIQNLIHRELFPLYVYTVGDELHPATDEELDDARDQIESLRAEGAMVVPFRHKLEAIGTDSNALDATGYVGHFLQRVAIGLGVFPHHLGMVDVGGGGNRSMTDRLDTALYDRIKEYQRYFAEALRFFIFDELLKEGGFNPMDSPSANGVSDRCIMKFREIDIDTQIKKESHTINKATAGVETQGEARLDMGRDMEMDEDDTVEAKSLRLNLKYAPVVTTTTTGGSSGGGSGGTTSGSKKAATAKTVKKASMPADNRGPDSKTKNVVQPRNQFGTRTSPAVRRSLDQDDELWLNEMEAVFSTEEDI